MSVTNIKRIKSSLVDADTITYEINDDDDALAEGVYYLIIERPANLIHLTTMDNKGDINYGDLFVLAARIHVPPLDAEVEDPEQLTWNYGEQIIVNLLGGRSQTVLDDLGGVQTEAASLTTLNTDDYATVEPCVFHFNKPSPQPATAQAPVPDEDLDAHLGIGGSDGPDVDTDTGEVNQPYEPEPVVLTGEPEEESELDQDDDQQ